MIAERHHVKAFGSIGELLPEIDVVSVAVPTSAHYPVAKACLQAGKHVLVEKPMALNLRESVELVRRAGVANRLLSVFHNRRWDVDYLTVLDAVKSGRFGKLIKDANVKLE